MTDSAAATTTTTSSTTASSALPSASTGVTSLKDEIPTIRLMSSEGNEFIIHRECALISGTIRSMLTSPGPCMEQSAGEISFQEITAPILEKVIQYFYYKVINSPNTATEIPDFLIEPEIALDLLMAANFLDT
ncbi:RNA polymerase II transcription elongation factor Elongin/SIII, subunit elongin C [Pelomyxa schiedti]|nr:RNA polymerase II transcription elongation factor Elongin/SIII, subunit elongin C [Pelomyxa schiedti]